MCQRELKIAVANSRLSTTWDNSLIDWPELTERLSDPRITHDTVEQFHSLPKAKQADIKDVGGFVGGHLAGGRRKKATYYPDPCYASTSTPHQWTCSTH